MDFVSRASEVVKRHGFEHFGWCQLETPLSLDIYREWLKNGHHAGMEYLREHLPFKEEPRRLAPRAQSALVITQPYLPHPYPPVEPASHLRQALYAQGEDYHRHFTKRLELVASDLKSLAPDEEFLCFTDSAPILERDLAFRAGLGWFGKNTCLIDRQHGSLFFIGQILTSTAVASHPSQVSDHCGTCDRCLTACPTGALVEPRTLDANLCISYWTIEARTSAPENLRAKFEDWFFGCDICQTVCPWNEKAFDLKRLSKKPLDRESTVRDLRWILTASGKTLERAFHFSPLSRARPLGLKRNALVVIGNMKLQELKLEVESLKNDTRFKELADWTLRQLT